LLEIVSIPLRGKGKRKVKSNDNIAYQDFEMFQSPCGEKVSGKLD